MLSMCGRACKYTTKEGEEHVGTCHICRGAYRAATKGWGASMDANNRWGSM